jgi:hypothetical protein
LQPDDIMTSVESLEAQLDCAKEYLRDGNWDRLEELASGISRTADYLASAVSTAKLEIPTGGKAMSASSSRS